MQHIWWVDSRATRQGGGLDAQDIQLNKPGGTPMSYLRGKGKKKSGVNNCRGGAEGVWGMH